MVDELNAKIVRSEPIELAIRYVPLTYSRVREMIDRLEDRMMTAVSEGRSAYLDIKMTDNGALRIELEIGSKL